MKISGNIVPDRGKSLCKCSEVGMIWLCLRQRGHCDRNTAKKGRVVQDEAGEEKRDRSCGSFSPDEKFGFKCDGHSLNTFSI